MEARRHEMKVQEIQLMNSISSLVEREHALKQRLINLDDCIEKKENIINSLNESIREKGDSIQNLLLEEEKCKKSMENAQNILQELEVSKKELEIIINEVSNSKKDLADIENMKEQVMKLIESERIRLIDYMKTEENRLNVIEEDLNKKEVSIEKREGFLENKKQRLIQYKKELELYYNREFKDLII